ncbi:MAG: hypothetical protein KJ709_06625 [Nanoarchaeota archaeon]|nr:hypothetical protein [Nanoarchaeota archaeon]
MKTRTSYLSILKLSFDIIKLRKQAVKNLIADSTATGTGIVTMILASIFSIIGAGSIYYNGPIFAAVIITHLLTYLIGVSLNHVFAGLLKGKGRWIFLFRAYTNCSVIYWFGIIPYIGKYIGFIASLWMIIVSVFLIERIYGLSRGMAILAFVLPIIIISIIIMMLGALAFIIGFSGLL